MTKTEKFVEKAQRVHNEIYSYDKVVYTNQNTQVEIFCKECKNYFRQAPKRHLSGRGCRKCADTKRGNKRRLTTEEFIEKAKNIHKDKYIYDKVKYVTSKLPVKIFCKKCNKYFEQIAGNHLNGGGCKKCGESKRSTTEQFVKKAKKIHRNKYKYEEANYLGVRKKIKIYCNSCKDFFYQKPLYHLQGKGCHKCVTKESRSTTDEFVKKAIKIHKDKFRYDKTRYLTAKATVEIFCKKCKEYFKQTPINHLSGNGCSVCGGSNRLTLEEFKERSAKVHKNEYNYDKVKYVNAHLKVKIFCKKCKEYFEQTPASHLMNVSGCPVCRHKNEREVGLLLEKYFKPLGYSVKRQQKIYEYIGFDSKKHRRNCDYYLKKDGEKPIVVEYDGEGHFEPVEFGGMSTKKAQEQFRKRKIIDELDYKYCEYKDIILQRIKYTENKEELILKLISIL